MAIQIFGANSIGTGVRTDLGSTGLRHVGRHCPADGVRLRSIGGIVGKGFQDMLNSVMADFTIALDTLVCLTESDFLL